MNVVEHAYFAANTPTRKRLKRHLNSITQAIATLDVRPPTQSTTPANTARNLHHQLDEALAQYLGAQTNVESALPYHPNHTEIRPALLHLDALHDDHAYQYCLRRYQDAMFSATTGWAIAQMLGTIASGTMIATTTRFARDLLGYPSPYARYMALLTLAEKSGTLTVPTLLIAIEPA